jgi:putative ABC transport system permease protein
VHGRDRRFHGANTPADPAVQSSAGVSQNVWLARSTENRRNLVTSTWVSRSGSYMNVRHERWVDRLVHDVRVATRSLRRSPTFTVTAVLVLGVGIGMSVAMFTVIRAVLIQRLPVLDQDRLVVMWPTREGGVEASGGTEVLSQLRRETHSLRDVAGVAHWGAQPSPLLDGDRSLALNQTLVEGNFFDVLGARPVLGRLLRPDDEQGGKFQPAAKALSHVVVISYGTWLRQFGGDSSVIGRRLIDPYSQWSYMIVGVAPPGLEYPAGVDCWVPIGTNTQISMIAVGRLRPGASAAAARFEYLTVAQHLLPEFRLSGAVVHTLPQQILGDVRPALMVLTAAVALLLLIACVDLANLMLLRVAERGRELAVRRAIGASAVDLVRQLLAESAVLAMVGGLLGLGCAQALLRALVAFAPPQLPRVDVVRVSGAPVALAIATTLVTVLFFGIVPAIATAYADTGPSLRIDARSGGESRRRRRLRELLVTSQVALALVMVAGAVLLAHSLVRLQRVDLGYRADHLSVISISFPAEKYDTTPKINALGEALFPRIRAIPGVTAVTPVLIPPFIGPNVWQLNFVVEGQSVSEADKNPLVPVEAGDVDYFRTFGIPIIQGRGFSVPDGPGAPLEVVVSDGVARRFWPGQNPVGKRIRFHKLPDSTWRTVVGVVADIHFRSLREPTPMVFMRWQQSFWQGLFAVRTRASLGAALPSIRSAVQGLDPGMTIWVAETMDDYLAGPLAEPRLNALLLSGFGFVALLLAALGLYGVMASAVRQRTREIGVRMALGATAARVRREVLGAALALTTMGIVVGAVVAFTSAKLLSALLYGVSPTDPIALIGACVLLLGVGLGSAYLPARRATRVDPVRSLRAD